MPTVMGRLREMEGATVRVQTLSGETITGRLAQIDASGALLLEDCSDHMGNPVQMMVVPAGGISHIGVMSPPMGATLDDMVLCLLKERKASSLKEVARLLAADLATVRKSAARLMKDRLLPDELADRLRAPNPSAAGSQGGRNGRRASGQGRSGGAGRTNRSSGQQGDRKKR